MTVAEWWEDYLSRLEARAAASVDDAVDALSVAHKNQREDIRNRQHERRLAAEAGKGKAGASAAAARRAMWDIRLTVAASPDAGRVGASWTLSPRAAGGPGGMCRVGRSAAPDFAPPLGASLSFDPSVSHWHGKFTCFFGRVFYTDLGSSNGSCLNG